MTCAPAGAGRAALTGGTALTTLAGAIDPLAPIRDLVARMGALQSEVVALREENARLREENAQLKARVAVLEDRLRADSSNSSKPPSSDGPAAPTRTGPPSPRSRGGQPGHRKHERTLLPPEEVEHRHEVRPTHCRHCAAPLAGDDPDPWRHQQVELPPKLATVTEWRLHALTCAACGRTTRATPPPEAALAFGPRLHAALALLLGRFRLSHRSVPELLREVFGIAISDGAVTDCAQRVSEAIAAPVERAAEAARAQPVAHLDETGWRMGGRRAWLWVMATTVATIFLVRRRRSQAVARELLGPFEGVAVSDRWAACDYLPLVRRQLCWAHLLREWQRFVDRGELDATVGAWLRRDSARLFRWWHHVRDGTLSPETLRMRVQRLRGEVRRHPKCGVAWASARTAATCREVLDRFEALWTFAAAAGVEPTNNRAERAIRPAVLWRKGSFGNDSERGARFTERMLTVAATRRQHDQPVFPFLVEAVQAQLQQTSAPPLIPSTA